jgi:hypothetical protein
MCCVVQLVCVHTVQFLVQTAPITNEVYTRVQSMSSSDQSQEIGKLWNEMPRYYTQCYIVKLHALC